MAKKTATITKKAAKGTKAVSKNEISAKTIGRNVILIIEGTKFSRALKEKQDRDHVMTLVMEYNKRNSKKKLAEIIEMMQVEKATTSPKVKKEEIQKSVEKVSKPRKIPAPKEAKKSDIEKAKSLLESKGFKVIAKEAPKSKRRSGEY